MAQDRALQIENYLGEVERKMGNVGRQGTWQEAWVDRKGRRGRCASEP